ncbi:Neuralized and/or zf-C3HC4 3 domain containing protein [Asbolus verrucosus]|uniref:Neuralized and/or zf-C3HC4 3 domain containing protein n=1 Tax=Asbolus verrucosus TaxID=1661398 RepID=A0A482VKP1_ASBVE|nr:Neuralized and/or zf-C3HC4 3 domain containing protein [Asbolus verrucosus]
MIVAYLSFCFFQLHFHDVHGANISVSANGLVAQHLPGYGKSLVFSSRPIKINERIAIKFLKLSERQSNTICFGFTSKDPNSLSDDSQSSYLDLFKSDYWIWPLFKNMCIEDTVLFYYVSRNGEVHFGIDDREIDSFYKKVDTEGPLWAILDIDGDSTTVQLVSPPENDEPEPETGEFSDDVDDDIGEDGELCTVCCLKVINAVLYKCGHMAMCYDCAVKQKQSVGNGQCPFCRADIKDVIRIYK